MADTETNQLIIYVGTQAKINLARQQGQIGDDDFAVVTDAPDYQEKLTSINAGDGISITEVNGILKISNTQTSAEWGNILGNLPDQTDLWAYISSILSDITGIKSLIPAQATDQNQLADKEFVNSSIATNTANFIGTFESVSDLEAYSGTVTNNDYAFVINGVVTDNGSDWSTFNSLNAYDKSLLTNFDYAWVINGSSFDLYRFDIVNQVWELRAENITKDSVSLNTAYNRYKATVSGSIITWEYEYTLNNSSFTAAQWEAINSGATATNIGQITTNQNAIGNLSTLTTTAKNNLVEAVNEVKSTADSKVSDVTVNGTSVVSGGVAAITVPTQPSDIGAQPAGSYVTTDTAQTITAKKTVETSSWNGGLTLKRTTTGSSFVVFENSTNVLGGVGLSPSSVPISTDRTNQNAWSIIRGGAWNNPAVGNSATPVYVDSNGMAQECTGIALTPTVTTLANNSTVTLASNTIYNGGTLTALTIQLPTGVDNAFTTEIDFTSGATATTFSYPASLKWIEGDNVVDQVFTPSANKRYICMIVYDGTQFVGTVRGVE